MMNTFITKPLLPTGKIQRLRLFEFSLYAIIFVTALGIPFFLDVHTNLGWKGVRSDWVKLLPFVLIFLANNYLLVPKLLFKDKFLWYVVTCILSVIVVVYLSGFLLEAVRPEMTPFEGVPPLERMPPPSEMIPPLSENMPPPPFDRYPKPPFGFAAARPIPPFFHFGMAIIAFLLIGFNTGIKSFVRWSEEKVWQAEKERQHYFTELAFLKHQISPHFFMNTLNNIHALVDINAEKAKNAIIKLSNLMRYLLYESDVQQVSLRKEIQFIESYIELMRLRYDDDNLTVETEYPDSAETIFVPSSLFLSFIENAFKHGIHPQNHSLITISFSVENGFLTFCIANYRWDIVTPQTETTGIGLENVRKRLDLIYRDNYTLNIQSSDIYTVTLKIPVS